MRNKAQRIKLQSFNVGEFSLILTSNKFVKVILKISVQGPVQSALFRLNAKKEITLPQISAYANKKASPLLLLDELM